MGLLNARRLRATTALAAAGFGIYVFLAPMASADQSLHSFNIPPENTAQALSDFAGQAGIQMLFPYDVAAKYTSPALKGSLTREAALKQLLADTELEIANQTDTAISLRVRESPSATPVEKATEVIVTGSHIRGGNPTSPVHTLTRKDIDQSGYSQIGDLVRSLPEDFSGGQNRGVIGAGVGNSDNSSGSSGATVNLRGLGTDATLVLVNGHRLSGDTFYQGADISGIPLAAVGRVEVVPDGASALYGSDAVAGVVNFVLRKDYSGGEVSAHVGAATQGGGTERTVSALDGLTGDNWYLLANLEGSDQDAITAGDRAYTRLAPPAETLEPATKRTSFYIGGGWTPNDRLDFSADALVSDRTAVTLYQSLASAYTYLDTMRTPAYSASISADVGLVRDWKLHLTGVTSASRNSDVDYSFGYSSLLHYRNSMHYFEASGDGTLFHWGDQDVKAAIGIGQRTEGFIEDDPGGFSYQSNTRRVDYIFAETSVPFVSPSPSRVGLNELELNLSGRSEHYTVFGTSTTPRVGLRYVPLPGLTIRGSWGKSFKAPSFVQLYSADILYVYDAPMIGGAPGQTALMNQGGNPDLKPERSTSWTLGAEFSPPAAPTLTLGATYFHVAYTDRVVQPIANLSAALSDPTYGAFVNGAPTNAEKAQLVADAYYVLNFSSGAYDPSTVTSIVQDSYANATSQTVHGVDVSYRQTFDTSWARLSSYANATWLTLDQQTLPTLPSTELSGTVFYAPRFKARGGINAVRGAWSGNAIVNFVSSEKDPATAPAAKVASWTTVDANLAYQFEADRRGKGLKLVIAATNLFDKAPPRTVSPLGYTRLNYDSTNASIVGRFVSATLSEAW